ncbi:hypothetical protein FB451DRAFT_1560204 [Mycena latifolia]|nr:hypothetical protein FB451DRAFT_1560204 [Mycena latifolia]
MRRRASARSSDFLFPIRAGSPWILTRSSHATRRFCQRFLDLPLDTAMHVWPPALRVHTDADVLAPRPTAPGLAGAEAEGRAAPPATYFMHLCFVLCAELRRAGSVSAGCLAVLLCCTRTRLLCPIPATCATGLGPRLQRCVDMSPPLAGLPRTPSSGAAASSPYHLIPSQIDANTEYTLSHDAGSPSDWQSYRARRPAVPPRLDFAPATRSHGEPVWLWVDDPDTQRLTAAVDTMRLLCRRACATCKRDCRLPTIARASDARAAAPTPSRAPARASAGLAAACPGSHSRRFDARSLDRPIFHACAGSIPAMETEYKPACATYLFILILARDGPASRASSPSRALHARTATAAHILPLAHWSRDWSLCRSLPCCTPRLVQLGCVGLDMKVLTHLSSHAPTLARNS